YATTSQARCCSVNDWTPRLDAYFASPLALCARRVSSAASRLLGTASLRFALHGWQRWCIIRAESDSPTPGGPEIGSLYRKRGNPWFPGDRPNARSCSVVV
ncbi:hypothetical protein, partial [Thiolapillus sp.]|uniref:hypothetical protein n=2 Tax=Thiolapillus sp. TaxID=2017437 RepID=UPI003AF932ED